MYSSGSRGEFRGLKTPLGHGGGVLDRPVSVANITVKEHVYRPTSELVSILRLK